MSKQDKPLPIVRILTPPARLYESLRSVVAPANYDGEPVGQVLARAVGREPLDSKGSWYLAFTELNDLMVQAETFVKQATEDYENSPHARTFQALSKHFGRLDMHVNWSAVRPTFDPLVNIALPFSVHASANVVAEHEILMSEVASVQAQLEGLVEQVRASDYPAQFREELITALALLADRIHRFELFGPEGVKQAMAVVVGSVAVSQPTAGSIPEVIRSTADLVTKVADVFLKVYAVGHIAGPGIKALLTGGQ